MFKRLLGLLGLLGLAALTAQAGSLSSAQDLMKLGFYAGAEESFREQETIAPSTESAKGLLQALLAQEKTSETKALLMTDLQKRLTEDEKNLYKTLANFQEGVISANVEIGDTGLDKTEKGWLIYIKGLAAFNQGDVVRAEELWRGIGKEDEAGNWAYVLANDPRVASPGDLAKTKEIEKRIKKMRRQDWPVIKNMMLAMINRGDSAYVKSFLTGNNKFPKIQKALILVLALPANSPERSEALMKLIPQVEEAKLLVNVVSLTAKETAINLSDVETQLGPKIKNAQVAVLLAQALIQKGALNHAYEVLKAAELGTLSPAWRMAYYSTLASLAEGGATPRYREAADALMKWRELPTTKPEDKQLLTQQIGDAYLKNSDWADAAGAYEKGLPALGFQAVAAWLKADKPAEAKRILLGWAAQKTDMSGSGAFDEAVLNYLMYTRDHGDSVEAVYKELGGVATTGKYYWPVEYLRIEELQNDKLSEALAKIDALKITPEATYKVYFDLKRYRLLVKLGKLEEAEKMLSGILRSEKAPKEFVMLGLERALREQRAEDAMELWPKVKDGLSEEDKVEIALLVARELGNPVEQLTKIQKLIETLAPSKRITKLMVLAKRWASIGQLDKATAIVEALQESSVDGAARNEVDFLHEAILELQNDPTAETVLISLSQRDSNEVKLRAFARLAAFYVAHGKTQEAARIFYNKLARLTGSNLPETLQPHRSELLKSLLSVAGSLPQKDAESLRDWVEAQGGALEP